ncbi:MAG: shikimate dehydrogenase [Solidesulfovibrio sp. DCME]|uniref:shikimate dehydrogenase n=1 Tax=Solidesulfovibrio sp. DCME TaxID=3447380 RepID=UPI003D0E2ED4
MTGLYGIIGHPLAHSLSPLVHNWGFSRFGIDSRYEAWDTPPEGLAAFMDLLRQTPIQGLSVTIPHKTPVMGYADAVTDLGREVGAVNTLYWRGQVLWAENTDVEGFCRPLIEAADIPDTALVLGAGGAARAAVVGLKRLGLTRIGVTGRTPEKAAALAWEFELDSVGWEARAGFLAGLLVNATPMGMSGRYEALSPFPAEALRAGQVVYDLVYNPRVTRFVAEATAAGARIVSGLDMFLYQAIEQFRLWTGRVLPVEELRPLLEKALYGAA